MKAIVNAEIERLEAKMTDLRKRMGVLYSFEMVQIDAQIAELYKLKRKKDREMQDGTNNYHNKRNSVG